MYFNYLYFNYFTTLYLADKEVSRYQLPSEIQYTNVTDGRTDRQTDGRTPGDSKYRTYAL